MNAVRDAALAASLFSVDPHGVGGVCVRSPAGAPRDQWLKLIRHLLPVEAPLRRIPFSISDTRLLGGLDLTATLCANRPIAERGVMASAHGGVVVVVMAERLTAHTAASLNRMLDRGEISVVREAVSICHPARVGIVALDEGMSAEEFAPNSLIDRLAFLLDFNVFDARTMFSPLHDPEEILAARDLLPQVKTNAKIVRALCAAALHLGAGSPRVTTLALHVARIAAALDGRTQSNDQDAVVAATLVLAPRASIAPDTEGQETSHDQSSESLAADPPESGNDATSEPAEGAIDAKDLEDLVLAATQASIPSGLLERLRRSAGFDRSTHRGASGRVGALLKGGIRGRPTGVIRGVPGGSRLNLIETLRAAAPWQGIRGRMADSDMRVRIHAEDLRSTCYKRRSQTLTIFVVDASGSAALNRLAEAKGAVELLLADCYIRRDQVAVIAFRGRVATILLPPTRSLVRAKRSLAGLPGGGATPLAAAIDSAVVLSTQARRRGESATMVLLTDGRANVARDGGTGRQAGHADALSAAKAVRAMRIASLFIDTSPRPEAFAQELSRCMLARYIALPFANAQALSKIVTAVTKRPR